MAEEERKWPVVLGVGALVAVPLVILPPPEEVALFAVPLVILPEPQVAVEFPALQVYPGPLPPFPQIVPPTPTPQRPIGEQVSVDFPQQQVAPGATIRASKTWRNTGVAGTRDIYAAYGTGETPETFDMEFGGIRLDQYCAAGAEVTTPVDCAVPVGALGLKTALVGVGKYNPTIGSMTFDDYEIVSDAIEVLPAGPPILSKFTSIVCAARDASGKLVHDWEVIWQDGEQVATFTYVVGTKLSFSVDWARNQPYSICAVMNVTKPDGTTVVVRAGSVSIYGSTFIFILDQAGTYSAKSELYAGETSQTAEVVDTAICSFGSVQF